MHLQCFSSGRKAVVTAEDGVDFDGTVQNLRRSKTVPAMLRHVQRWEMQTPVGREWGSLRMTMDGMERVRTNSFGLSCYRYPSSWEILSNPCS